METITSLQRALAVAKAKEVSQVNSKSETEKKNPKYTFLSPEFKSALDNLTKKGSPMDPAKEIKNFNQIVEARGYDFFSEFSMADWRMQFGNISNQDIMDKATIDTQQFLYAVAKLLHPEHEQNRHLFKSQFDSNENSVKNFFIEKRKEETGRNNMAMKDVMYEQRFLNVGVLDTKHKAFEHQTLKDLMSAKWAATGYAYDDLYKDRFISEYSITLK